MLAAELIEDDVRRLSLDEILAYLRAEVRETGTSDVEIGELLKRAKHDLRRERKAAI